MQRPDYVLAVNLEKLRNKIPQIKNEAELDLLQTAFQASLESDNNPIATITMQDGGRIQLELYPDVAPNTVSNFISLAQQGFYDGLTFHRVVPNFIIQGGDPQGDGTGGPGYTIKGEFAANGFSNNLSHTKGVISMARTADNPNSAGSQFFIMVGDAPYLDGQYAAFGQVISGQEVADRISRVPNDGSQMSLALEPPHIQSIIVETFDVTSPQPRTLALTK
ncbi:MAG: peptidylprolyl isomerase [Firmicutes bacterium]|nr:peptidylprolyl isomerase [Bacillota bacterium]